MVFRRCRPIEAEENVARNAKSDEIVAEPAKAGKNVAQPAKAKEMPNATHRYQSTFFQGDVNEVI